MNKRRIFTIGETIYDIIFRNGKIEAGKAGGSMLNASVSLGRLGMNVVFISEVGSDDLGATIVKFLEENGINTSFIQPFTEGKTPVALAFLDENQNANYTFYKHYPAIRLNQQLPEVSENDIVLFGSFFSISPEVRLPVLKFIRKAKEVGAVIIYDPNIRKSHSHEVAAFFDMIYENLSLAGIVRASHEDFKAIFGISKPDEAFRMVKNHSDSLLVFTKGGESVDIFSAGFSKHYPVPKIEVVSTIGAGDNFNAGIAFSLIKQGIFRKDLANLSIEKWDNIISTGIRLSAAVCGSFDNYIPERAINNVK